MVPQGADGVAVEVQGHFAGFIHLEDRAAQLLRADEHIVRHGVAAEQGAAVVWPRGSARRSSS